MAVHQRFNALTYPNAVFQGQPLTIEDVLNSRVVNDPPHWLECVMPRGGAAACLVTSAERAKSWPHPPGYLLGAGAGVSDHDTIWQSPRMTTTPVVVSALDPADPPASGAPTGGEMQTLLNPALNNSLPQYQLREG